MEKKATLISLGLALFAMYLVYQYLQGEEEALNEKYGQENYFNMVVANRDILQFQTIRPTDVEIVSAPAAFRPPNLITDPKDIIDAVAAVPLAKGEWILDNKIISKNIYSGLDTQIQLGKRAISIPVTQKSGVGYLIRPGNRVDLAAHFEFRTKRRPISEVKVFMQDLLVLATGRTIQADPPKGVDQGIINDVLKNASDSGARNLAEVEETLNYAKNDPEFQNLTLEVTPRQAQQIVYVMSVYQDSLIAFLRHSDNRELTRVGTTNLRDVMGEDSYYVRSQRPRAAAPMRIPKRWDIIGGQPIPVYD